ncbi:hypothetical protein MLD38_031556 [Melastoma candidum]|uniref:Uncharacterized protein n=1 Tax=Melastoma candidum TaxID=119954 RepID=A0ACB9MTG4_9MYRT|nr:hypothetical protein MLD38_031556 [Melastoma candidum]
MPPSSPEVREDPLVDTGFPVPVKIPDLPLRLRSQPQSAAVDQIQTAILQALPTSPRSILITRGCKRHLGRALRATEQGQRESARSYPHCRPIGSVDTMDFRRGVDLAIIMVLLLLVGCVTSASDDQALLAIRRQIQGDPLGLLRSWNDTSRFCEWQGVTCNATLGRVTVLNLSSAGLVGVLSPEIGNLTFLRVINLQNNSFHGPLPQEIGRLSWLTSLLLGNNSFEGDIPVNLSRCSRLVFLDLHGNNIYGKIPVEIGLLTDLQGLQLTKNSLSGSIPSTLGNISSLQILYLGFNYLTGSIPPEVGSIPNLQQLFLSSNNLTGAIPLSLYNISSLTTLALAANKLSGGVQSNLATTFPNLQLGFFGGNEFSGPFPSTLPNTSVRIDFSYNHFTGPIPKDLGHLQNLQLLSLSENPLGTNSGDDLDFIASLTNCSMLQSLWFSQTNISGVLPSSVYNLSATLSSLQLDQNYISGTIQPEIANLVNLNNLILGGNMLTGSIPGTIGQLSKLQFLQLIDNRLSGNIPVSIGNLSQLGILGLEGNAFNGSIPVSLGDGNLQRVYLSRNELSGMIPESVTKSLTLSIFSVYRNRLSGQLQTALGSMKNIWKMDLSENELSGEIPATLGDCVMMDFLNLAHNNLQGAIPSSFGQLKSLQYLDLSDNRLTGNIPDSLEALQSNGYVNLSFNDLQGEVPKTGLFANTSAFSISGNLDLCGGVEALQLPLCPNQAAKKGRKPVWLVVIIIVSGISFALFLLCVWLVALSRRKKREPSPESPRDETSPQPGHPKVSYSTLHNATDGFSSTNLIGEGSFGMVYKGVLGDREEVVAVKVLKVQIEGVSKNFVAECEALRHIRHRNLVRVITSCSSIDRQGNEFKALVFDYMSNGSLEKWLHPTTEQKSLTMMQRLNIITDIANAINYLHNQCHTPIVHCDLKPSNVLLDKDLSAHVGDFGLAKILSPEEVVSASLGIRGTIGYVAPEYSQGKEASTQADIYSYGILVLETFTGKRPTESSFLDNHNLRNYVQAALPDRVMEIADPMLIPITDGSSSDSGKVSHSNFEECLMSVLRIGVACSAELPSKRTSIVDICNQLRDLMRKLES